MEDRDLYIHHKPRYFDPDAPVLVRHRSAPILNLKKYLGRKYKKIQDGQSAIIHGDTASTHFPDPMVAKMIAGLFLEFSNGEMPNHENVRDLMNANNGIAQPLFHGIADQARYLKTARYNTAHLNRLYNEFYDAIQNIYQDDANFDQYGLENDSFKEKIASFNQAMIYEGLYRLPYLEKYVAATSGVSNILVFREIKESRDLDKFNKYWDRFENHIHSYDKSQQARSFAGDDFAYAFISVNNVDFTDVWYTINDFNSNFSRLKREDKKNCIAKLQLCIKDLIDTNVINLVRAIIGNAYISDLVVYTSNIPEFLVSVITFLIKYSRYYEQREDKKLLPIELPIPLRYIVSFEWIVPIALLPNVLSPSHILNMNENNVDYMYDEIQELTLALWEERASLTPVNKLSHDSGVAPQLLRSAYSFGVKVPRINHDGSLHMANFNKINANRATRLRSHLRRLPNSFYHLQSGNYPVLMTDIKIRAGEYDEHHGIYTFKDTYF